MMKIAKKAERALDRKKETEQKNRDTVLLILSVGFLVGGVLGCLLEGKLSTEHYIGQFFQQAAQMSIAPSLWREVWIVFRWPVAVILLSQLPLAGVTIPVVFFLRGFFLSYGIVALMEGMGLSGVLCAGVVFGPTCCAGNHRSAAEGGKSAEGHSVFPPYGSQSAGFGTLRVFGSGSGS
ncbi:hypothetical protein [Evtepia gabavorous]|uniref:hypothetical protein n=1 Tax=Evtepia gabavorous TaxID=2211183 RepID=UPI003AF001DF